MLQLIGPFRQLLTMGSIPLKGPVDNNKLQVLEHAGIIVEDGLIRETGNFDQLAKKQKKVYYLEEDYVALPGFIDVHTHLIWAGSRAPDFERRNSGMSYQEILDEGGGIHDTVNNTTKASLVELETALIERVYRHVSNGVTTIEVKTGYGLSAEHEIRLLSCIKEVNDSVEPDLIPTFLGAHVCPSGFEKKEYLDHLIHEAFPLIRQDALCDRVDIFIEEEAFAPPLAESYLKEAKKSGFSLTAHVGQFSPEGVAVAVNAGALSADHLETITEQEIEMLGNSTTAAVALPGASLGLGMKFTPLRKILDAGGSGVIATDWNPGSAPMGDLIGQCSILATYEKLCAAEVFSAITFRAANALQLTDRGQIERGYLADVVAFQTSDYREILYQQGQLRPGKVWKKGKLQ